jgi:UDP-glucuronate 4-epimerase
MTSMSVLVTGAAGFVGSHVVDHLLERGAEVVGLDNLDTFYDPAAKARNLVSARQHSSYVDIVADLLDPDALERVPDRVDEVLHFAARAGVRPSIAHPDLYMRTNVEGTARLIEWARQRGVRRFVLASSSSVYGNSSTSPFSEDDVVDEPISPYAASKRAAELLCYTYHKLYGMNVVVLRLFTVYGPRQRPDLAIHKFANLLNQGAPIPMYGDGSTQRDYTYISDVLAGLEGARAYSAGRAGVFEIFNIGESRTIALGEMIAALGREMGVTPNIQRLPPQPGDVERTLADVSKARRLLGYEPCVSFGEGLRKFIQWYLHEPRS